MTLNGQRVEMTGDGAHLVDDACAEEGARQRIWPSMACGWPRGMPGTGGTWTEKLDRAASWTNAVLGVRRVTVQIGPLLRLPPSPLVLENAKVQREGTSPSHTLSIGRSALAGLTGA